MERIGKIAVDRWWRVSKSNIITRNQNHHTRLIVTKAPNRAAVHGARLPVTKTIDKEELEMVIDKEKRKRNKGQEVEKKPDSKINQSDDDISNVDAR